jgi:hypothetical protein
MLGGSSSMNAMIYIRANDYAEWATGQPRPGEFRSDRRAGAGFRLSPRSAVQGLVAVGERGGVGVVGAGSTVVPDVWSVSISPRLRGSRLPRSLHDQ